jgi:hypothetical protein
MPRLGPGLRRPQTFNLQLSTFHWRPAMPVQNIKHCLLRFQSAVKDGNGMELSAALAELDGLVALHRNELHPQLRHYLEGRSYAKALAWLGLDSSYARPSSPPEGCGGKH